MQRSSSQTGTGLKPSSWPRFSIRFVLAYTVYFALLCVAAQVEVYSMFLVPAVLLLHIFWVPHFLKNSLECPEYFKFRYHLYIAMVLLAFTWPYFPYANRGIRHFYVIHTAALLIGFKLLVGIQFLKWAGQDLMNLRCRAMQIYILWTFVVTTIVSCVRFD